MKNLKQYLNHIFIDGLSGMALGLFSTLIIGTILQQIGNLIDGNIGSTIFVIGKLSTSITCAGIGVGVAYKFKETPLVVISASVCGMIGGFATKILDGSVTSFKSSNIKIYDLSWKYNNVCYRTTTFYYGYFSFCNNGYIINITN